MSRTFDVAILGSGFGGSLLATALASRGRSVIVIDRARHPRFAIGESSTPLADQLLDRIADEFALPALKQFSTYGRWKTHHPTIGCGLKRGFTYLAEKQPPDTSQPLSRMLVAASSRDEVSDTHWLRSDVDAWFFRHARLHGAEIVEDCSFTLSCGPEDWKIALSAPDIGQKAIRSRFLVDATGQGGALSDTLQIPMLTQQLKTRSRAVYGHFSNVARCGDLLTSRGQLLNDAPFPCDAAAVHVLFPDCWMWQLRFDDQTVSAGFSIVMAKQDGSTLSPRKGLAANDEFHTRIRTSPFLEEQFRHARVVRPPGGIRCTTRLQRLVSQAAGDNWAALPHAAGFVDPLHSTGIAHTLTGVLRLAQILTSDSAGDRQASLLADYSADVIEEIRCVDELVEGCQAALPNFDLFCDFSMLYFAAVTSMEQAPSAINEPSTSFLRARDPEFRRVVGDARRKLQEALETRSDSSSAAFRSWLRLALTPWNRVGLFDDACNGLYASTAAR